MFGSDEIKKKQMILRKAVNCSTEDHPKMDSLVQFLKEHPEERALNIAAIKQDKYPLKSTILYVLSVLFFTLAAFFAIASLVTYMFSFVAIFNPIIPPGTFILGLAGFVVGLACVGAFLSLGFLARSLAMKHDKKVNDCLPKKIENLIESNVVDSLHLPAECAKDKVLDVIAPMALDNDVAITVDSSKKNHAIEVVNTIQKSEFSLYHIWNQLLKMETPNQDIITSIFSHVLNLFSVSENEGPSPLHLLQKKLTTPMPRTIHFFDKEHLEAPIERPQNLVDAQPARGPV